ncbi:hypothetical protein E2P81_ATG06827 [Venturia nashicola]|uniref:Fibroin-3 related protein n=1 Tax=Venturia nashicola TaxID=86259 RepID=A0A4Z1NUA9_9PEZI|nr:hypothetical protein E6O75_ATG06998 [Venturia nashicola]TLD30174.1 hypothetical protein E2P81_ATG06827 [Venturia nashicola]
MRLHLNHLFPRQTPALPTELPKEVPSGVNVPTTVPTDAAGIASAIPSGVKLPSSTGVKLPSSTGTSTTAAATGTSSPKGIMGTVGDVKDSFTSWDKCMTKTYCKWPVIVVIVVGSLILLSVLFCVGRCLCCGAECACFCFRCCAGCCDGSKNKKSKFRDPPAMPSQAWNQQYQSQPHPAYAAPTPAPAPAPTPFQAASAAVPQFATFETSSKKIHEDSLPEMPSWETAAERKVEVWEEPEAHELEKLSPHGQATTTTLNSGVASPQPIRPGPGPPSPYSEHDNFLAAGSHQYGASTYSLTGGQVSGVTRGDRYHSPSPGPYGGYGSQHNVSQPAFGQQQNVGQSPYGQTQRGYGQHPQQSYGDQQPYGGSQQNSGRQDDRYRPPVSPVYSGSTVYEPPLRQQDRSPPYSNAAPYGQQGRRPVNGSWKDI